MKSFKEFITESINFNAKVDYGTDEEATNKEIDNGRSTWFLINNKPHYVDVYSGGSFVKKTLYVTFGATPARGKNRMNKYASDTGKAEVSDEMFDALFTIVFSKIIKNSKLPLQFGFDNNYSKQAKALDSALRKSESKLKSYGWEYKGIETSGSQFHFNLEKL